MFRSLLVLVLLPVALFSQDPSAKLPPVPRDDLRANKLYGDGVLQVRKGLYLDAVKSFEECLKLDPDALPPRRMLATHLLTVGRPEEALAMAREVTNRAPEDHDAWRVLALHLHDSGQKKEAIVALARAIDCESLAKYPDHATVLMNRLGNWAREASNHAIAERAARKLLDVLEKNRERFKNTGFLDDDAFRDERAVAAERLGEAQLKLGRPDEALRAFEIARASFTGRTDTRAILWSHRLHWHLAQVQRATRNHPAALEHVQTYLKHVKPGNLEPYRLLTETMFDLGQGDAAAARVAEFGKNDPDNVPLQIFIAQTHARAGQDNTAVQVYLDLAKKFPRPEVYRGLFALYGRLNQFDAVLQKYDEYVTVLDAEVSSEEAKKKAAEHVRPMTAALLKEPQLVVKLLPRADEERSRQWMRRQNNNYQTFGRLLDLAIRTGELDAVETMLRESARAGGGRRFRLAQYDDSLLQVLLVRHKYEDAKSICRDRLGAAGDNLFMYYYYLDQALYHLGEFDEALRINEQTSDLARNEALKVRARLHRADILYAQGEFAAAMKECRELLDKFPQPRNTRTIRYKMATLLSHARRFEEAEKLMRQMLEQDPNDATICNLLGYELADQNRKLGEAESLIRRALELDRRARRGEGGDADEPAGDDDNAAYLDSLAWVLFRKGQATDARAILEKALLQPDGRDQGALWDHLGDVCFRSGDATRAREAWRKAQEFYRFDPLAGKDGRTDEVARKLRLMN